MNIVGNYVKTDIAMIICAISENLKTFRSKTILGVRVHFIKNIESEAIATGFSKDSIFIWRLDNQILIHAFSAHKMSIIDMELSNDGKFLVSGSGDQTVKLWDRISGKLLQTFKGHKDWVHSVAISSNK